MSNENEQLAETVYSEELLNEKSLWEIFRKGPSLFQNRFNRRTLLAAGVVILVFILNHFVRTVMRSEAGIDFPKTFDTWANIGISFTGTILGFLLAGFAILFTILRPQTALWLALIKNNHKEFSELKLLFITFADVVIQFIALLFFSVCAVIVNQPHGIASNAGRLLIELHPYGAALADHIIFVGWALWLVSVVLKLKSFTFNLYQALALALTDSMDDLQREQKRVADARDHTGD